VKLTHTVKVAVVAVVIAVVVAVGATAAVTGAATGSTTYFGCLKAGKLAQVGTAAPTCPTGATQIQWDSQGPAGPQGNSGAQGPVGQASIVNLPSAVSCPTPGPVTAANVPLSYLGIPTIPGESTDTAHANQITVLSWSLGTTGPGGGQGCGSNTGPGGQGAGGQTLTIVKGIDKATPPLMLAATAGTNLGTVTLAVTKQTSGAAAREYLRYTFTLVQVKSVSWSHDDVSPKEVVTFTYGGMQTSYVPQNPDGSNGTPITACFNFNAQSPC